MTCRQFSNLTFAPRNTCATLAATSRFIAINVTARISIYDDSSECKPFFKFFRHLCTEKVKSPTLQVHYVTPQSKQQPPYMYTSLPSEVNNFPHFRTQNMPRNASTTGFFSPPNINKGILISCCHL